MFQYLDPKKDLTLQDIRDSVEKNMISEFGEFETLIGKLFDQVEIMLSDLHSQANTVVEKAKEAFVNRSVQDVYSGVMMIPAN